MFKLNNVLSKQILEISTQRAFILLQNLFSIQYISESLIINTYFSMPGSSPDITREMFNQLPASQKITVLYEHGVYVGKRKVSDHSVILFQLFNFYVEIIYTVYRKHIAAMHVTDDIHIITPYLDQIDVKELIVAN